MSQLMVTDQRNPQTVTSVWKESVSSSKSNTTFWDPRAYSSYIQKVRTATALDKIYCGIFLQTGDEPEYIDYRGISFFRAPHRIKSDIIFWRRYLYVVEMLVTICLNSNAMDQVTIWYSAFFRYWKKYIAIQMESTSVIFGFQNSPCLSYEKTTH